MLPCLQAQGTVTAVQLQTEAPVVTASGQQVQTLQVVVSPPACVSVMTVSQPASLHAYNQGCSSWPHLCAVLFILSPPACLTAAWTACSSAQRVMCWLQASTYVIMTVWAVFDSCFLKQVFHPRWGWKLAERCYICCMVQLAEEQAWIYSPYWLSLLIIYPYFCLVAKCQWVSLHGIFLYGTSAAHLWMQVGFSVLVAYVNANQCDRSILSNHVLLSKSSWNDFFV